MSAIHTLAKQCSDEQKQFLRGERTHSLSCYELFRMALVHDDQDAWSFIYQQFNVLVKSSARKARMRYDEHKKCEKDDQELADDAFVLMRKLIAPETFINYESLGVLLSHLKKNAMYALLNCSRTSRAILTELTEMVEKIAAKGVGRPVEDMAVQNIENSELLRLARSRCKDEKEKIVFGASIMYGLKPSQAFELYEDVFSDVNEIYRIKANLLERLSRDPKLVAYLTRDDDGDQT